MDVFNINDLIYKVNINTTSDTSNQQTMEYKDVLDKMAYHIQKSLGGAYRRYILTVGRR